MQGQTTLSLSKKSMFKRYFSISFVSKGLFKDYIKTLKVKEITPSQLAEKASKISGFPSNFHLLDCREVVEYNQDFIPYSHYTGKLWSWREFASHH